MGVTEGKKKAYPGLAAYYGDEHRQHVRECFRFGSWGSTIMSTEQTRGDWSDPPVPDLVISILLSDPLDMTSDFGSGLARRRMLTHSFVVVPPDYPTQFLMEQDHSVQFLCLPYRSLLAELETSVDQALPGDGDLGVLHSRVWQDRATLSMMRTILAEARSGNPHGMLGADGLMLQLVAAILTLRNRAEDRKERSGLAPWQLRRVIERIEDDLAHDLSLQDLGTSVGLSPFHLCRAFARSTGLPPHKWRLKRRIERAQNRLLAGREPITAIALDLGFASSQHFAAAFKAATGVSPSSYRVRATRAEGIGATGPTGA